MRCSEPEQTRTGTVIPFLICSIEIGSLASIVVIHSPVQSHQSGHPSRQKQQQQWEALIQLTKDVSPALQGGEIRSPHSEPALSSYEIAHRPMSKEQRVVRGSSSFQFFWTAIDHRFPDLNKLPHTYDLFVSVSLLGRGQVRLREKAERTPSRPSGVSCRLEGDINVELLNSAK